MMIKEITLRPYGGSLGTTLPKAMTDRLNLEAGLGRALIAVPMGWLM